MLHPASFRDPAGHLFERQGQLRRAVHPDARTTIEQIFDCGLHDQLVSEQLIVAHDRMPDADRVVAGLPDGWLLLAPRERLPVISYACEWTDQQLRDAALLTLEIQRRALKFGFSLKDASAFNVQFRGSHPIFIDILSFERPARSNAWVAYRQFCEHFLGPLAWRSYLPGNAGQALVQLNGIALQECSRALPARSWLKPGLTMHLHLHAWAAPPKAAQPIYATHLQAAIEPNAEFLGQLTASLRAAVLGLSQNHDESAWARYRAENTYSDASAQCKLAFILGAARASGAGRALDLGANDGHYSRALATQGIPCTSVELDRSCSEMLYRLNQNSPTSHLLNTLRVDLSNPTPAHGWGHEERASFADRLRCDLVLALALVHHLSISGQVPFSMIASFFSRLGRDVIVEYVPVNDPMSQRLLAARTGVTPAYLESLSESAFLAAFASAFDLRERRMLPESGRVLHHFSRRG